MGASVSTFFPTKVLDCADVEGLTDARYEYQCSASEQVRMALTTIHLLVMVAAFLMTMILYTIYTRVLDHNFRNRVVALQGASLPFMPGEATRFMYKKIVATYAMTVADELLSRPAKGNVIEGAKGWGVPGSTFEGVHFKVAILGVGSDLHAYAREALLALNAKPNKFRLDTLRGLAPDVIQVFNVPPETLWPVVVTVERAEHLKYEFTADEFALFRSQVWSIMDTLRRVVIASGVDRPRFDSGSSRTVTVPLSPTAAGIGLTDSPPLTSPVHTILSTDSFYRDDREDSAVFAHRSLLATALAPVAESHASSRLPSPILPQSRDSTPKNLFGELNQDKERSANRVTVPAAILGPRDKPLKYTVAQRAPSSRREDSSSSCEGDFEDAREPD